RREQEPLVAMRLAAIVDRPVAVQVELDDPPAEEQLDAAEVGGAPPDRRLVLALPERLGERRPGVGRVELLADEPNRPVGVVIPDAAASGVPRHPPADDQIAKFSHHATLQFLPFAAEKRPMRLNERVFPALGLGTFVAGLAAPVVWLAGDP